MRKRISGKCIMLIIVTIIFILVYILLNKGNKLIDNLINGVFLIGLIYILTGMAIYVRNVGLFKTFRYLAYKVKVGAYNSDKSGQIKTMSLAEFNDEIMSEKNQRPYKVYFWFGLPLLLISYLLVFSIY